MQETSMKYSQTHRVCRHINSPEYTRKVFKHIWHQYNTTITPAVAKFCPAVTAMVTENEGQLPYCMTLLYSDSCTLYAPLYSLYT